MILRDNIQALATLILFGVTSSLACTTQQTPADSPSDSDPVAEEERIYCPYDVSETPLMAQSIDFGGNDTLIATQDGRLLSWGKFGVEELLGADGENLAATSVSGNNSGDASCLIDAESKVWCWGDNEWAQLGDGTREDRDTPVQVVRQDGSPVLAKTLSSSSQVCAIGLDDQVWCWGLVDSGNFDGEPSVYSPYADTLTTSDGSALFASSISMSASASGCAVDLDQQVWCWGGSHGGELGNDAPATRKMETYREAQRVLDTDRNPVSGIKVATGINGGCVIRLDNTLWCWGANQIPDVDDPGSMGFSPVAVQLLDTNEQPVAASELALTYWGGCFLDLVGEPYCWGSHLVSDYNEQPLATRMTKADGEILKGVSLAASWETTCMSDSDGALWCWGDGCIRGESTESNHLEQVFMPLHLDGSTP